MVLVEFIGAFSTGPETFYAATPPGMTEFRIVGGRAVCMNADPGDGETVTISFAGVDLGVFTFGSGIGAGAGATYVPDATNGSRINTVTYIATGTIKAVGSSMATTSIDIILQLDEYCAPLS